MENVGTVVGFLAMIIALAGVFYASTAMKKVDETSEMFVRTKIDPIAAEVRELKARVASAEKALEKLAEEVAGFKPMCDNLEKLLNDIEKRLSTVAASIG